MPEFLIQNFPVFVNSLGLVFDIAGALLVWKFGLPEQISRDGAIYICDEATDQSSIDEARKYDRFSHAGVFLLCLGFFFQLVSNFIKYYA